MSATAIPERVDLPAENRWVRLLRRAMPYLTSAVLSTAAFAIITRWWRGDWSIPYYYGLDSVSSAGHFRTVLETGWYEFQPRLGWPYGQRYHDYPFSDDLQPFIIKMFGWIGFSADSWPLVFNIYYVLGYPLAGMAAVFFFRRCGMAVPLAVALSVLFSVSPYHFYRNETHFFLGEYWLLPPAMWIVLRVLQGRPIWGLRRFRTPPRWDGRAPWLTPVAGAVTGRGAVTTAILVLVVLSGAYYAVFTGFLLGAATVFALLRRRDMRRFGGAVVAGVLVVITTAAPMVPDFLHLAAFGNNPGALGRDPYGAELYALTLSELLLPATGHPISSWAELRDNFNTDFPYGDEAPALGTVAAIGFLLLLGVLALILIGRWNRAPKDSAQRRRGVVLGQLAVLAWSGFLMATTGGLGSFIELAGTDSIRGWNRMSIFIMLFSLAAVGLLLQGLATRVRRRTGRALVPLLATVVLVAGTADQSLDSAIPQYEAAQSNWLAEQSFVDAIEALQPGGAIFQVPYMAWPESNALHWATTNDVLRLYLHSSTLRWSEGGIKGRPETEWSWFVSQEQPEDMVRDIAIVGFTGIVVDRYATPDNGAEIENGLEPLLGAPTLVSSNGRYSFIPLGTAGQQVLLSMTEQERAAEADRITRGASTAPPG
ncbi:hypothetical protein GIS00_09140 [Nakamurella sp. YIM 132087]|uniref:YfhO family protein n=1 Tax=Nakamurella alba TaxID=2665158 RepID=A0A7K1FJ39_9ACTN|nr:hypothetical protein [Nakamurella alba]MTD14108.1 hypothetical protein [Nakamurella alba]